MEASRQVRFQGDGLALNCLDYGGEGEPILFLHGGSAHAHWWDFVAPAFTDKFHALALDQRGHGDSDWAPDWAYGSRHYVSDLDRVVDQLSPGKPILIGHSMGGHNGLLYAAAHGRKLRGLVVVDTLPEYPQAAVDFLRTFAEKKPPRFASLDAAIANFRLMPRETLARREVLDHVARHTFRRDSDGTWIHKVDRRTFIREPLSIWGGLKNISCPALVLKVVMSPMMPAEQGRKMASLLPRGRYDEIGHAHHHAMLDNPDGFIDLLKSFLDNGLEGPTAD